MGDAVVSGGRLQRDGCSERSQQQYRQGGACHAAVRTSYGTIAWYVFQLWNVKS